MTDPRDTAQYRDLMSAHGLLERVMIVLDPTIISTTLEFDFQTDADTRGITLNHRLAIEIHEAMGRVANWIPCKFEGVPQCECDCPDCCPEPINGLH
tara:strand:- start:1530 stop:1820 length:291 start_codon:yes stop_codon:yes gene_type:complete